MARSSDRMNTMSSGQSSDRAGARVTVADPGDPYHEQVDEALASGLDRSTMARIVRPTAWPWERWLFARSRWASADVTVTISSRPETVMAWVAQRSIRVLDDQGATLVALIDRKTFCGRRSHVASLMVLTVRATPTDRGCRVELHLNNGRRRSLDEVAAAIVGGVTGQRPGLAPVDLLDRSIATGSEVAASARGEHGRALRIGAAAFLVLMAAVSTAGLMPPAGWSLVAVVLLFAGYLTVGKGVGVGARRRRHGEQDRRQSAG